MKTLKAVVDSRMRPKRERMEGDVAFVQKRLGPGASNSEVMEQVLLIEARREANELDALLKNLTVAASVAGELRDHIVKFGVARFLQGQNATWEQVEAACYRAFGNSWIKHDLEDLRNELMKKYERKGNGHGER